MEYFVDELPNCCGNCGFCCKDDLGYWCQAKRIVYIADKFLGKKKLQCCPLQSIADHDKQVRKEVCEEIREEFKKHLFSWYENEDNVNKELYLDADWLWKILDQIQGDCDEN